MISKTIFGSLDLSKVQERLRIYNLFIEEWPDRPVCSWKEPGAFKEGASKAGGLCALLRLYLVVLVKN